MLFINYYETEEAMQANEALEEAIENKMGSKLVSKSIGRNADGIQVAEFTFTWTFKAKGNI